jgi:hypothetical protein
MIHQGAILDSLKKRQSFFPKSLCSCFIFSIYQPFFFRTQAGLMTYICRLDHQNEIRVKEQLLRDKISLYKTY